MEIAGEAEAEFLIQVIFPFEYRFPINKETTDSVVIFPQTIRYNKNSLYEIEEPILYDGMLYSLDDFISRCPILRLDEDQELFVRYVFSLPFFMLETNEVNDFKRLYLTPIKNKIVETGFYSDNRGKIKKRDPIRDERDKFIIEQYRKIPRKKRFPIAIIKRRLIQKAQKEFKDDERRFDTYDCTDITIRRVLERYTKK
jgi:hypothetical protein